MNQADMQNVGRWTRVSDGPEATQPDVATAAIRTARLGEFGGEKEPNAQTSHAKEDWPLVILNGSTMQPHSSTTRIRRIAAPDPTGGIEDTIRRARHAGKPVKVR